MQLLKKIHDKGLKWLWWRIKSEIRYPRDGSFAETIINGVLRIRKKMIFSRAVAVEDNLLYSVYDLKIAPITYNITEFLMNSELEAAMTGKEGFVVVFVPNDEEAAYGYEEYDAVIDSDNKIWRFQNILLPLTINSPKCKGIFVLPNRSSIFSFLKNHKVYPSLYDGINLRMFSESGLYGNLNRPGVTQGLKAPIQGCKYIQNWIQEMDIRVPIVTITLRQFGFDKARNSKISEWSRVSKHILESGFFPVIIPDTDKALVSNELFKDSYIFTECAWNMGLRMALYELSFLNLFVPNGPGQLATFMPNCSYIMMNALPEGSVITTESFIKNRGMEVGENYRWATPEQRQIFKPDTYENIICEFDRFVEEFGSSAQR
jgi:hypothetical protein